jgi:hypothetical protein
MTTITSLETEDLNAVNMGAIVNNTTHLPLPLKLGTAFASGAAIGTVEIMFDRLVHIAAQRGCLLRTQQQIKWALIVTHSLAKSYLPLLYSNIINVVAEEDPLTRSEKISTTIAIFLFNIFLQASSDYLAKNSKQALTKFFWKLSPLLAYLVMMLSGEESLAESLALAVASLLGAAIPNIAYLGSIFFSNPHVQPSSPRAELNEYIAINPLRNVTHEENTVVAISDETNETDATTHLVQNTENAQTNPSAIQRNLNNRTVFSIRAAARHSILFSNRNETRDPITLKNNLWTELRSLYSLCGNILDSTILQEILHARVLEKWQIKKEIMPKLARLQTDPTADKQATNRQLRSAISISGKNLKDNLGNYLYDNLTQLDETIAIIASNTDDANDANLTMLSKLCDKMREKINSYSAAREIELICIDTYSPIINSLTKLQERCKQAFYNTYNTNYNQKLKIGIEKITISHTLLVMRVDALNKKLAENNTDNTNNPSEYLLASLAELKEKLQKNLVMMQENLAKIQEKITAINLVYQAMMPRIAAENNPRLVSFSRL